MEHARSSVSTELRYIITVCCTRAQMMWCSVEDFETISQVILVNENPVILQISSLSQN